MSCLIYFGCKAEEIFESVRTRRGFDKALELNCKHKTLLNQFEELKNPNSDRVALWYRSRILGLAEEAKGQGHKTEKSIVEFIAQKVGRSTSSVKKWYSRAKKGYDRPRMMSFPGIEGSYFEPGDKREFTIMPKTPRSI